jgi:hypothetical protein
MRRRREEEDDDEGAAAGGSVRVCDQCDLAFVDPSQPHAISTRGGTFHHPPSVTVPA